MKKALEILKDIVENSNEDKYDDMTEEEHKAYVYEPIIELEEAMKPKTCLNCVACNKDYQLMSNPPQFGLKCGVFKTVFVNDFKQSCSKYTPKDTQC